MILNILEFLPFIEQWIHGTFFSLIKIQIRNKKYLNKNCLYFHQSENKKSILIPID